MGKRRQFWHSDFEIGLFMALVVAALFSMAGALSGAGIIMLASIAASIVMLIREQKHRLMSVGTAINAYAAAAVSAAAAVYCLRLLHTPALNQAIVVFGIVALLLYLLDISHPPAVLFAVAYVVYGGTAPSYFLIAFLSIVMFIAVRFAACIYHKQLGLKQFAKEFAREEKALARKEGRSLKSRARRI